MLILREINNKNKLSDHPLIIICMNMQCQKEEIMISNCTVRHLNLSKTKLFLFIFKLFLLVIYVHSKKPYNPYMHTINWSPCINFHLNCKKKFHRIPKTHAPTLHFPRKKLFHPRRTIGILPSLIKRGEDDPVERVYKDFSFTGRPYMSHSFLSLIVSSNRQHEAFGKYFLPFTPRTLTFRFWFLSYVMVHLNVWVFTVHERSSYRFFYYFVFDRFLVVRRLVCICMRNLNRTILLDFMESRIHINQSDVSAIY